MVRILARIHKKTKHTNLETAANAAYVNKGTCYWAFTLLSTNMTKLVNNPAVAREYSIGILNSQLNNYYF